MQGLCLPPPPPPPKKVLKKVGPSFYSLYHPYSSLTFKNKIFLSQFFHFLFFSSYFFLEGAEVIPLFFAPFQCPTMILKYFICRISILIKFKNCRQDTYKLFFLKIHFQNVLHFCISWKKCVFKLDINLGQLVPWKIRRLENCDLDLLNRPWLLKERMR